MFCFLLFPLAFLCPASLSFYLFLLINFDLADSCTFFLLVFSPFKAVSAWCSNTVAASVTYGDISTWDVSAVADLSSLFSPPQYGGACSSATSFNDDVSKWDVSGATSMSFMFAYASVFNVDISKWDVGSVTAMGSMFFAASAFNVDLSAWDVGAVLTLDDMFGYPITIEPGVFSQVLCWDLTGKSSEYMFNARVESRDDDDARRLLETTEPPQMPRRRRVAVNLVDPSAPKGNCAAGKYYVTSSGACESCDVGRFKVVARAPECEGCAPGFYAGAKGLTSCSACAASAVSAAAASACVSQCAAGTYTSGSACLQCAVGLFSRAGSAACLSCSAGTYSTSGGSSGCTECAAGKYSSTSGQASPDTCVNCLKGTFSAIVAATECAGKC